MTMSAAADILCYYYFIQLGLKSGDPAEWIQKESRKEMTALIIHSYSLACGASKGLW